MTSLWGRAARSVAYALVPAAALVAGSPVAFAIWDAPRLTWGGLAMVAPFYMGLLSAPAYLYLAYAGAQASFVGPKRRWWVRGSLVVALAASVGGIWGGTLVFLLLPPSLISAIAVVILWRGFERVPRQAIRGTTRPGEKPGVRP
jgi:hypothetical protein